MLSKALRALCAAFACVFLAASADAADRPLSLLVVDSQPTEPYRSVTAAMLAFLAEHGYSEATGLRIVRLSLGQHEGQAENIWKHYDGRDFSVVYVSGTLAARAFAAIMRREPDSRLVFSAVTDPVGVGLIDGFGTPPTRNITGVSILVPIKDRLRFARRMLPQARTFGCVYSDMPQSASYRRWVEEALAADPEFKDIRVLFRRVEFVPGDQGTKRMVMLATAQVEALAPEVDAFLAPVDPLGLVPEFDSMVTQTTNKPLIGIIEPDVRDKWGATMTISPSLTGIGRQAGRMVARLLAGEPVAHIPAEPSEEMGVLFDDSQLARFGLAVPADLRAQADKTHSLAGQR